MLTVPLRRRFRHWSDQWLRRRAPRSRHATLDQRRIFILPTRNGLYFLVMVFAIFLGGINYGNSLILGTAFLLASLFMVSILHTFANLSGLVLEAGRAEAAFVGEEAAFSLRLRSGAARGHEAIRLRWGKAAPQFVDLVERSEAAVTMLLPVIKRGYYRPRRLKLETWFPLGLLRAWSWIDLDMAAYVYPAPIPCEYPQRLSGGDQTGEQLNVEGSDDFDGLRSYRPGDSPRQIAWRSFARSGELHSKAFIARRSAARWVEWEAFAGVAVEERLGRLCYWVRRLTEQHQPFGLRLPGLELQPDQGREHERRCLEALALYGLEPAP